MSFFCLLLLLTLPALETKARARTTRTDLRNLLYIYVQCTWKFAVPSVYRADEQ